EAAVTTHQPSPGNTQLIAYHTPAAGHPPATHHQLHTHLRKTLPDHMLPTTYIHLDHLPHTPNGKLDRHALPKPRFDRARRKHVEPANEIERHLVEVVADLLAIDRVSVEDDFFELGAHSLLAMQAISRIRTGLGIDVPVRLLFENPSV